MNQETLNILEDLKKKISEEFGPMGYEAHFVIPPERKQNETNANPLNHTATSVNKCDSSQSPRSIIPGYLNEIWEKKKGRLSQRQCITLGAKIDEGWMIYQNTTEFIHIIYKAETKLMNLREIYERK